MCQNQDLEQWLQCKLMQHQAKQKLKFQEWEQCGRRRTIPSWLLKINDYN
jgi:hypothetical protein